MLSQQLKIYNKETVLSYTSICRFETRIGEVIQVAAHENDVEQSLRDTTATFVIVGVPEDIGIRANGAEGGAMSAWTSFLHSFLNHQSNDFFEGNEVMLLGHLNFAGVTEIIESNAAKKEERIEAYRHSVSAIDDALETVVKSITSCRKIPIVISGGNNNAYGCIKGAAKGWHKEGILPLAQLNVVSLDAQSGYKPMEGRHSGNAFRYADEDGYLQKYCVVGLHENELPQNTWLDIANNPFFDFITYEDIFLHGKQSFVDAVHHAVNFTSDTLCGIEISLNNVLNANHSAVGISLLHARQFVHLTAVHSQPAYLHIAEPAARNNRSYDADTAGKIISYLVSDFIKVIG